MLPVLPTVPVLPVLLVVVGVVEVTVVLTTGVGAGFGLCFGLVLLVDAVVDDRREVGLVHRRRRDRGRGGRGRGRRRRVRGHVVSTASAEHGGGSDPAYGEHAHAGGDAGSVRGDGGGGRGWSWPSVGRRGRSGGRALGGGRPRPLAAASGGAPRGGGTRRRSRPAASPRAVTPWRTSARRGPSAVRWRGSARNPEDDPGARRPRRRRGHRWPGARAAPERFDSRRRAPRSGRRRRGSATPDRSARPRHVTRPPRASRVRGPGHGRQAWPGVRAAPRSR